MSRKIKFRINRLINNLKQHFLIIGKYTGEPIGCTCGKKGKEEVLEEEPGATFRRISKKKCPICNEDIC